MNMGKLWEMLRDREAWPDAVHGVAKSLAWLGNWTATTRNYKNVYQKLNKLINFGIDTIGIFLSNTKEHN